MSASIIQQSPVRLNRRAGFSCGCEPTLKKDNPTLSLTDASFSDTLQETNDSMFAGVNPVVDMRTEVTSYIGSTYYASRISHTAAMTMSPAIPHNMFFLLFIHSQLRSIYVGAAPGFTECVSP